jgi:hypothetical protein
MGLLRLAGFTGMWPVRDARALPDNAAVEAINIRPDGGAYLKPARQNPVVAFASILPSHNAVFPIQQGASFDWTTAYWMKFNDAHTDVVRGPLVNDSFERYYWASPSTGLRYAPKASIVGGSTGFEAGVPAPTAPATLDVVAGSWAVDGDGNPVHPVVTRAYVTTFINVYGEESQPGPAVEDTGPEDADWLLTVIQQPAAPGLRAAYDKIRIYRTVTGLTGQVQFYKVVDLPVGTTFYNDVLSDLFVTGQVTLDSTLFATPPALHGLVAMPNGILVGFIGNQLYFSENYRPHAWPAEYMITVDFPIVGLGVYGNTCVVCTTGNVFLVQGTQASALSLTKTDAMLSCLSRKSIVSAPEGVYFASEPGLVLVGPSGIKVVTEGLFSREQWVRDYLPTTLRAMYHAGEYIALLNGTMGGFRFSPANPEAMGVVRWTNLTYAPLGVGVEPWTGKPYLIVNIDVTGHAIAAWEPHTAGFLSMDWRSKEIQTPYPTNFSCGQVYYDDSLGLTCTLQIIATLRGNDGTVQDTLVYDQPVAASGREFRLPSGFKADIWQLRVTGSAVVQSILLATSVRELRDA